MTSLIGLLRDLANGTGDTGLQDAALDLKAIRERHAYDDRMPRTRANPEVMHQQRGGLLDLVDLLALTVAEREQERDSLRTAYDGLTHEWSVAQDAGAHLTGLVAVLRSDLAEAHAAIWGLVALGTTWIDTWHRTREAAVKVEDELEVQRLMFGAEAEIHAEVEWEQFWHGVCVATNAEVERDAALKSAAAWEIRAQDAAARARYWESENQRLRAELAALRARTEQPFRTGPCRRCGVPLEEHEQPCYGAFSEGDE